MLKKLFTKVTGRAFAWAVRRVENYELWLINSTCLNYVIIISGRKSKSSMRDCARASRAYGIGGGGVGSTKVTTKTKERMTEMIILLATLAIAVLTSGTLVEEVGKLINRW